MHSSRSVWGVYALASLAFLLGVAHFWLVALNWSSPSADAYYWRPAALGFGLVSLVFAIVGLFVAYRRPDHAVGWLLAVIGLLFIGYQAETEYAVHALLVRPGALPFGNEAGVVSNTAWVLGFAVLPVLFLYYPTGRLLSKRWRIGVWMAALAALSTMLDTIRFWPYRSLGPDLLFFEEVGEPVEPVGTAVGILLLLAAITLSIVSTFVRMRRGGTVERLQIKWLWVAGFILLIQALVSTLGLLSAQTGDASLASEVILQVALTTMPLAIALAILRYRLFEIDRIVSRTVTYALVSGLLVLLYLGLVFALRNLLPAENQLAVAGSTLLTAAAFNPLRRWVQSRVDRRFNRAAYDAERALASFRNRLQNQTDIAVLSSDIRALAAQTVQPGVLAVWIR